MLALFGNISLLEIVVIAALSVMIFGRDLPRVAAQVFVHIQRARRSLQQVWRESGVGEEIRQVQREIERGTNKLSDLNPAKFARKAVRDIDASVRKSIDGSAPEESSKSGTTAPLLGVTEDGQDSEPMEPMAASEQPLDEEAIGFDADDGAPTGEPAAEASRRPPWYPEMSDPFDETERREAD